MSGKAAAEKRFDAILRRMLQSRNLSLFPDNRMAAGPPTFGNSLFASCLRVMNGLPVIRPESSDSTSPESHESRACVKNGRFDILTGSSTLTSSTFDLTTPRRAAQAALLDDALQILQDVGVSCPLRLVRASESPRVC